MATHGTVLQTRSAQRLFGGDFTGGTSVDEEFGTSQLGLGVMAGLDGEVVSIDGTTWRVPVDGVPVIVDGDGEVAFGVAAHGGIVHELVIAAGSDMEAISDAIEAFIADSHENPGAVVAAVRIDGAFRDVLVRTIAHPDRVGETLCEVIDSEIRFPFESWHGTLVGFRFPEHATGPVIPGLHLHALAEDRQSGGHVRDATAVSVAARIWLDDFGALVEAASEPVAPGGTLDFGKLEGPVS